MSERVRTRRHVFLYTLVATAFVFAAWLWWFIRVSANVLYTNAVEKKTKTETSLELRTRINEIMKGVGTNLQKIPKDQLQAIQP